MQEINLLRQMLQQQLRWNAARVTFVAIFLIAPIRVRTVNLAEIATGFSSTAKLESRYKRLQRFFRDFTVDCESIALMVVKVWTADREFVGKDWFAYLLSDPCTRFRIRIRKNTLLGDGQNNYGLMFVAKTCKWVNPKYCPSRAWCGVMLFILPLWVWRMVIC